MIVKDPYFKFKERIPFARTHLNFFLMSIRAYRKDYLTIEELKNAFKTRAWMQADLWKLNSEFMQLLKSLPGQKDGKLYIVSLEILALLMCTSSSMDKA